MDFLTEKVEWRCVDGRWGTVCSEGWGDTEAGLVCARLGFPATSEKLILFLTMR